MADDPVVQGALDTVAEMETLSEAVVTDDFNEALAPEDNTYEWEIPTGREDANGNPTFLRVKARDPRNNGLLLAYLMSEDKETAAISLWEACIVSPAQICEPDIHKRLTTAFSSALTMKILVMLGMNQDFFENLERMMGSGGRRPKKSSMMSPPVTGKVPVTSGGGVKGSSSAPTSTPEGSGGVSATTSSQTSASSEPSSSEARTQSTPMPKTGESSSASSRGAVRIS